MASEKKPFWDKNQKPSFLRESSYTCSGKVSNKSDEWFLKKTGYRRTDTHH